MSTIQRVPIELLTHETFLSYEEALEPFVASGGFNVFAQWRLLGEDGGRALTELMEEGSTAEAGAECSANDHTSYGQSSPLASVERASAPLTAAVVEVLKQLPYELQQAADWGLASPRYYGGPVPAAREDAIATPTSSSSQQLFPTASAPAAAAAAAAATASGLHGLASGEGFTVPDSTESTRAAHEGLASTRNSSLAPYTPLNSPPAVLPYSHIGGVDIIDNVDYLRKNLLSLKVNALRARRRHQHQQQQQQQQQPTRFARVSHSSVDHGTLDVSASGLLPGGRSSSARAGGSADVKKAGSGDESSLVEGSADNLSFSADSSTVRGVGGDTSRQLFLTLRQGRHILRERSKQRTGCPHSGERRNSGTPVLETPSSCASSSSSSPLRTPCAPAVQDMRTLEASKGTPATGMTTNFAAVSSSHSCSDTRLAASAPANAVSRGPEDFVAPRPQSGIASLRDVLRAEPGCLYVKASLSHCTELIGALELPRLTFPPARPSELQAHGGGGLSFPSSPTSNCDAVYPRVPGCYQPPPSTASSMEFVHQCQSHGGGSEKTETDGEPRSDEPGSSERPSGQPSPGRDTRTGTAAVRGHASYARKVVVKTPVASPLLLKPGAFAVFGMLAEVGAGTRAHVNVKGSHAWHVLLSGRKLWAVAHPLEKHLVTNPVNGQMADLFHLDETRFPESRHARVFYFIQEAGEAVFLPSEAVHEEMTLEASVSVLMDFMDSSGEMAYLRCSREIELVQSTNNADSLLPDPLPFTTVDLVLFDNNVYPSFRGNQRSYRPDDKLSAVVLRGMVEFSQVPEPCSELGARLELEALQTCFHVVGETMLNMYDPPRYAVGVPKGYLVSSADHRLILYYFVEPFSLREIRECLSTYRSQRRWRKQLFVFDCQDVTLPNINYFRSTVCHQGLIPNYVPLSVLFNQVWSFERDLCQKLVSLPHIILEKAYHPLGFIRPGSVWHYSRFDLGGQTAAVGSARSRAEGPGNEREVNRDAEATALGGPEPSTATLLAAGPSSSFVPSDVNEALSLEQDPSSGWCRTFLFYCSPLLDNPVTMHPLRTGDCLQDIASVSATGPTSAEASAAAAAVCGVHDFTTPLSAPSAAGGAPLSRRSSTDAMTPTRRFAPPRFHPRLLEFEWNASRLEEYGLVSLLDFSAHTLEEMKQRVFLDPCFERFNAFVQAHCLKPVDSCAPHGVEKIMAVVLWFMCRPCVVGYTFGSASSRRGAESHYDEERTLENQVEPNSSGDDTESYHHLSPVSLHPLGPREGGFAKGTRSGNVSMCGPRANESSCSNTVAASEALVRQWDTVCLTGMAASALLNCVPQSLCSHVVTRLCNWLCDLPEEDSAQKEASLFRLIERVVAKGDVEEQAVITEVIKIKRRNLLKYQCCHESAAANVHVDPDASQPTATSSDMGRTAELETFGLANADKLARVEAFHTKVERRYEALNAAAAVPCPKY